MRKRIITSLGPIIGHRGVAALAPENTLESFALAHHYGLQSVEFDVILSADGEAFVFHDESLARTSNGRGEIGVVSSDYIKSLDAGAWFSEQFKGAQIPTLRDTLIWLRQHKMTANIEIKPYPGFTHETVKVVLQELDALWPSRKTLPLISSFDSNALRLCRALQPNLPLGYLLDTWHPKEIQVAQALNCVSMNLNYRIARKARVQALKNLGFAVYVYTVNYQFLISKLFAMEIDGVFSDYPKWRLSR